ncbi:MAG TPA: LCP family protein [Solirubrobacteraceae bacterium]|nr:LCP family protein [Solirubrobacteraceae bacterium]
MSDDKPEYKVYRSRPRLLPKREEPGLDELRERPAQPDDGRPDYEVHRGGRGLPRLPALRGRRQAPPPGTAPAPRPRRRITPGRVLRWVLLALAGWVLLSAVLFMVSAQIQRGDLADAVGPQLSDGPYPLTGANTILVLGSDARSESTAEPGSEGAPSRSDSIMLLRIGGGANASLSVPRDTIVDIPGHGRNKINAAYAFGGAELATRTVKDYMGVEIDHVVEVSFENFPQLVDALGGVTYKGGCVVSKINGGKKNGGTTLRLKKGETEIDGDQALALARTRKNDCAPNETDIDRARRQQQLVAAMKDKVTSFETFARLPWVSWAAPKAVRSDMSGPTLLGVAAASMLGGDSKPQVLKPSGGETLPDGGLGLIVDESEKEAAVTRLLRG